MRVVGQPLPNVTVRAPSPGEKALPREVEPTRTPVSRAQIRRAIEVAHERKTGQAPSRAMLDVLVAHVSHETAQGGQMHNFNFGGIKGAGPSGLTAVCRTHEVIGGEDKAVRAGFRAYGSLEEGASDYLQTMTHRFPHAMVCAEKGDVVGFSRALKRANYYTASEEAYTSALVRHHGGGSPRELISPGFEPRDDGFGFASARDVSLICDALACVSARELRPRDSDEG